MKIAILQTNPIVGDTEGNAKDIADKISTLPKDVDVIVTPELSLVGYPPKDILLLEGFAARCETSLLWLAQELKAGGYGHCAVLIGTVTENTTGIGKPLYNTAALLQGGKITRRFFKSLLPTYGVFDEDRYFEPRPQNGRADSNVFTVYGKDAEGRIDVSLNGRTRIGVTICEDLWNDKDYWGTHLYPVDPVEMVIQYRAEIIVNMSASPFVVGKQTVREGMVRAITKKYDVPVVYCNQAGGQDDIVFDGNSFCMNAGGAIVYKADPFKEDIIIADMENPPVVDLYHDYYPEEDAFFALEVGVRDYVRKNGFERVVIGLSGGIDSALTAVVACAALGSRNVHGVLMPSKYSSQGSIDDALELAKNLNIQTTTVHIEGIVEWFGGALEDKLPGWNNPPTVAEENIQARIRGTILMAFSNKTPKEMVLSTGNKSEMAVGYSTLYGDMCGGLDVLSDVSKCDVYKISKWYNTTLVRDTVIPQNTIDKEPSAELRPDQKDSDSLPPYPVLDTILNKYIVEKKASTTIQAETGYQLGVIEKVLSMVTTAEYKRKQAPPGIKITDTAFGVGWRMPTACKFKR